MRQQLQFAYQEQEPEDEQRFHTPAKSFKQQRKSCTAIGSEEKPMNEGLAVHRRGNQGYNAHSALSQPR